MSDGESARALQIIDGDCEEAGELELRPPLRAEELPPLPMPLREPVPEPRPRFRALGTMPPPPPRSRARSTMPPPIPGTRAGASMPPPTPRVRARGTVPPPLPPQRSLRMPPPIPPAPRALALPPPVAARSTLPEAPPPSEPDTCPADFDEIATNPTQRIELESGARRREDDTVRQSQPELDSLLSESWFGAEAGVAATVDYVPRRRRLLVFGSAVVLVVATAVMFIAVVDKATATRIVGRAAEDPPVAVGLPAAESPAPTTPVVEPLVEPLVEPAVVVVEPAIDSVVEAVPAAAARTGIAPRTEPRAKPPAVKRRGARKARRKKPVAAPNPLASARSGTLMLGSKPPCKIYIDGRNTGKTTPQRDLRLAPGKHKVTLRNAEHRIKLTFTVRIKPGQKLRIIKDLSDRLSK